jgi:flagellar biosynthesis protein FliQ
MRILAALIIGIVIALLVAVMQVPRPGSHTSFSWHR